ncbi:hypothetical protein NIES4071_102910 (plasmid) [Calothrix sp. NIES-4071]|nr:hypothetical protein NIES4071_102910 [Calothrix sp. NIES-4071]BAZ64672.1 hypothetical protein NIES4105_104050 [Calothrix sp. NIES-4105]
MLRLSSTVVGQIRGKSEKLQKIQYKVITLRVLSYMYLFLLNSSQAESSG